MYFSVCYYVFVIFVFYNVDEYVCLFYFVLCFLSVYFIFLFMRIVKGNEGVCIWCSLCGLQKLSALFV